MPNDRQWIVNMLRRLGYPDAADEAARVLPDPVSLEQIQKFADRYGISRDEVMSQMGASPCRPPHGRPWRPQGGPQPFATQWKKAPTAIPWQAGLSR